MTGSDKASLLDGTKWGNFFDFATLKLFARHMRSVSHPQGKLLREVGDHNFDLVVIVSGKVRIFRKLPDESEDTLITYTAGQTYGEMSFVDGSPTSAYIVTEAPLKALAIAPDELDKLAEEEPLAAYRFMRHVAGIIAHRLRRTTGLLVQAHAEEHPAPD